MPNFFMDASYYIIIQIPFQVGMSKVDFRKMLKSSLSGVSKQYNQFSPFSCFFFFEIFFYYSLISVSARPCFISQQLDKTINAMYRKLQKNITAEELLPSLWDKCKVCSHVT